MLDFGMSEPTPKPEAEDAAAFVSAVEKGLETLDRGRGVSYEKVRRWLLSWGTDKETAPPECP